MHNCLIFPTFLQITEAEQFLFNGKRGLAILVTCDYVGNDRYSRTLEATKTDADAMKETFEQLQYNVHQLKNKEATKDAIATLVRTTCSHLHCYRGASKNADGREKVIIFAFSGCGSDKDNIDFIDGNDGEYLSLKEDVVIPLASHPEVFEIPKLFFIDASRYNDGPHTNKRNHPGVRNYMVESFAEMEGNYRIDYATIPDHSAYITSRESKWIPVLARELRKEEDDKSLQNIAAEVKRTVYNNTVYYKQQSESLDRLNTGPLRLHGKKSP